MTSTYKNGSEVCKDWDMMVYRNGEYHQLPVEGK